MKTIKRKIIALIYGVLCHLLFLIAIGLMAYSLFYGMGKNILGLDSKLGLILNALLVLQFPFLHSFLLSEKGKFIFSFFTPKAYSRELSSTVFAIFASLQIIFVFALWSPTGIILWRPEGLILYVLSALYAFSWMLLTKSMYDAGLSLQTGMLGWYAVYKGVSPKYPQFKIQGLNKYCRQPMYLSFALILVFSPTWTLDHLVLASLWCIYCFYGPRFKEKRALRKHGEVFKDYQQQVPYWNFFPALLKGK